MSDERRSFPARTDAWPGVRAFVESRCSELAIPRSTAVRLLVIAEELFINIAVHGSGPRAGDGICIGLRDAGPEAELIAEDRSHPFDPFSGLHAPEETGDPQQRPLGGLGRALIAGLSSRRSYQYLDGCNRVVIAVPKIPASG